MVSKTSFENHIEIYFPQTTPKFPPDYPKMSICGPGGFIGNSLPNSSDTEIQMYLRQWTNCSLCQWIVKFVNKYGMNCNFTK